jgi:hypothetical protein
MDHNMGHNSITYRLDIQPKLRVFSYYGKLYTASEFENAFPGQVCTAGNIKYPMNEEADLTPFASLDDVSDPSIKAKFIEQMLTK